ncbi:MAG: hypothetical protein JW797_20385 [Bradymonadales bacterium]|nr:hypothetical protein [Bradymonadales bacterium]
MNLKKHFDFWTLLVIAITFILFAAALFTTGLTHDLLLEAGVFLVSVKLIMMGYKSSAGREIIQEKLDEIRANLQKLIASQPLEESPRSTEGGDNR